MSKIDLLPDLSICGSKKDNQFVFQIIYIAFVFSHHLMPLNAEVFLSTLDANED